MSGTVAVEARTSEGHNVFVAQYKAYIEHVERARTRQLVVSTSFFIGNIWLLVTNSFMFSSSLLFNSRDHFLSVAAPLAGIIICVAWYRYLLYQLRLGRVQSSVLSAFERDLEYSPFHSESKAIQDINGNNELEHLVIGRFAPLALFITHLIRLVIAMS